MKAVINIELSSKEREIVIKSISPDMRVTERAVSEVIKTPKGLKILIKANDLTSLKASINTCLKLMETSLKVIKNVNAEGARGGKGVNNEDSTASATTTGFNDAEAKRSSAGSRNRQRLKRIKK